MKDEFLNLNAFYQKAKQILPADIFNFIDGGSMDESALMRNRQSFKDIHLSPRVLRGLNEVSTQFKLFGNSLSAPILIAPAAYQGLLSENGELDMLAAANQLNLTFIVSMFSSIDYSLIAKQKTCPVWLQMYFLKDREINKNFIQQAEDLNFNAIVLTVDAPIYAKREREHAQPLNLNQHSAFLHLKGFGIPFDDCLKVNLHFSTLLDHPICWIDLDWLSSMTSLPIILKGIIDPRDTQIALTYPNVKGVIVSNHGGRQLDSSYTPIEVMHAHRKIAEDKLKLFLDGGINRGSDIFKSIALGADATLIGRAALWALAVGGSQGVIKAFSILQNELCEIMTLCGCSALADISSDFINDKYKE